MEFVYKPEDKKGQKLLKNETTNPSIDEKPNIKPSGELQSDHSKTAAEHYMVRVNWLYRPKDIQRKSIDTRLLYATMNSDICPIASIRGKCTVTHRDHIPDLTAYRAKPNCFWFEKLFDRYILSLFDVVPTEKIINIPEKAQRALCERFRFAIIEAGRAKELCSAPKNCIKCVQWCSPDDSVQCAHCSNHYHMLCVNPPLARKPSRGFGWSCAACSRAREQKMSENQGIVYVRKQNQPSPESSTPNSPARSNALSTQTSNSAETSPPVLTRAEELAQAFDEKSKTHNLTAEQKHQLKLWPFRYLGLHSKIEDVLDMDDRIYPRAASRLGLKHQCNVGDWPGHPVVYYESIKPEKKRGRIAKKVVASLPLKLLPQDEGDQKTAELLLLDKKDRPSWLQEKPAGYVERGGDDTATLMWKTPENVPIGPGDQFDTFLEQVATPLAKDVGVESYTPNYIDACLKAYMDGGYDSNAATEEIKLFTRKTLKEPTLTPSEVALFEKGVKQYGSELHEVYKVVKTKKPADIVRFYYLWKKTPNGHKIWDNYEGRKHKRKLEHARGEGELVDSVADNFDDAKYDLKKAKEQNRSFVCKHCHTQTSDGWQRAPGVPAAGDSDPIIALCLRCARLWKLYGIVWENPLEVMKKQSQRGSYGTKRLIEEELVRDAQAIIDESDRFSHENAMKKVKLETPVFFPPKPAKRAESETSSQSSESPSPMEIPPPKVRQKPGPKKGWKLTKLAEENKSDTTSAVASDAASKRGLENDTDETSDEVVPVVKKKRGPKPKVKQEAPGSSESNNGMLKLSIHNPDPVVFSEKTLPLTVGNPVVNSTPPSSSVTSQDPKTTKQALSENQDSSSAVSQTSPQSTPKSKAASVAPSPTFTCQVCMDETASEEQLQCENCGVTIHPVCYGVRHTVKGSWKCDACQNDAKPQVGVIYGCVLCPPKESNSDSSLFGSITGKPEAVKRTFGGNWAHVKCSIWISELAFGNVEHLQPIENVSTIKKLGAVSCNLCASPSGACVTCPHCGINMHVTCAEKANYKFKIELKQVTTPSALSMEFQGIRVTAKAVVLCPNAPVQSNMHNPNTLDLRTGSTLLQLYIDAYKKGRNTETGARKLASLFPCDNTRPEPIIGENVVTKAHTCSNCSTKSSPIWWDDESAGELCHACYWKAKSPSTYNDVYSTPKVSVVRSLPSSLKTMRPVFSDMLRSNKPTLSVEETENDGSKEKATKMSLKDILIS